MVQVKAGMLYCHLEHAGTTMGISMQPSEQILQEYPEMTELYEEVHNTFANSCPLILNDYRKQSNRR